jgi:hypothetical protein
MLVAHSMDADGSGELPGDAAGDAAAAHKQMLMACMGTLTTAPLTSNNTRCSMQ